MSTYNPYHPRTVRGAPRRQSSGRRRPLLLVIALLSLGIGVAFVVSSRTTHTSAQAEQKTTQLLRLPTPIAQTTPATPEQSDALAAVMQDALEGSGGTYAVVVKQLKTGEYYAQNEDETYDAASLYKLWVMAVIYEYLKAGRLQLDQVLSAEVTTLNETFKIASESAELTEGSVTYTVDEALEQMITISDNYAALLLTDAISRTAVADFLTRYGFADSHVGNGQKPPVTSANDMARLMEKLYDGQLVDAQSSQQMIERLKRQRLNSKIPSQLPEDVFVAHKTGELDDMSHDASIVYAPSGDFVLVVLSRTDDRDGANSRIAEVSKGVFDYFEQSETP